LLHRFPPLFLWDDKIWQELTTLTQWSRKNIQNGSTYMYMSIHRYLIRQGISQLLTSTSSLHSISTATINTFDIAGSSGNSTIWRPSVVRLPVLSSAPRIHSWYIELRILSWNIKNEILPWLHVLRIPHHWLWVHPQGIHPTWGGGSMKWNSSKSWTPRDLSNKTTFDKFVRWISGTVAINRSFL
jgi:hypothetical protein